MSIARYSSTVEDYSDVLQDLRDKGLDPSKVISCMPSPGLPGHVAGTRGCNVHNKCIFGFTRFGGFKGTGPKEIIYYYKPNDGTRHQKEDEAPCFRFIQQFLGKMNASVAERQQGKSGNPGPELINIIGWEDHPDPKCRQYRKKDRRKVDPNDTRKDAPFKDYIETVQVHPWQHPTEELGDSYEAQLEREAQKRLEEDADLRTGPAVHMSEAEAQAMPITMRMTDDDEEAGITSAAPVRKR